MRRLLVALTISVAAAACGGSVGNTDSNSARQDTSSYVTDNGTWGPVLYYKGDPIADSFRLRLRNGKFVTCVEMWNENALSCDWSHLG